MHTFDPSLTDAISRLRFALGDTDTSSEETAFLEDETYEAVLLASAADQRKATIALADALVVKFAQVPDRITLGDTMGAVEWKSRLQKWEAIAKRLRAEIEQEAPASGMRVLRPSRHRDDCAEYRAEGRVPW